MFHSSGSPPADPPISGHSQVERPGSPIRVFPIFPDMFPVRATFRASRRRDRGPYVAAPPSSTSTGRCWPALPARCSPMRCDSAGLPRPNRSRARSCCSGCSTRSARRLPSMALARQAVTLGDGPVTGRSERRGRAGRRSTSSTMVQPFAETAFAVASRRRTADRAGHHDAVRPRQAVRRPPRPRRRRRHPLRRRSRRHLRRHARRTVRLVGRQARRRSPTGPMRHDVDLAESYAYSDSVYDTPMLDAVGHPDRGQPRPAHGADGSRPALADAQPRRVARRGEDPGDRPRGAAARAAVRPPRGVPVRPVRHRRRRQHPDRWSGRSSVRNHRSYFDVAAMSLAIAKSGRTARFLGKKEVFDAPIVGQIAAAMGGIRVDRGTGSDEPLQRSRRRARRVARWWR